MASWCSGTVLAADARGLWFNSQHCWVDIPILNNVFCQLAAGNELENSLHDAWHLWECFIDDVEGS